MSPLKGRPTRPAVEWLARTSELRDTFRAVIKKLRKKNPGRPLHEEPQVFETFWPVFSLLGHRDCHRTKQHSGAHAGTSTAGRENATWRCGAVWDAKSRARTEDSAWDIAAEDRHCAGRRRRAWVGAYRSAAVVRGPSHSHRLCCWNEY